MVTSLFERASAAATVAAGAARHLLWYLAYQVDRTARERPAADDPRPRAKA